MLDWITRIKELFSSNEYIPKRCLICGTKMREVSRDIFFPAKYKIYQCENGHEYSPGLDVGDKGNLIKKSKGDIHGEI